MRIGIDIGGTFTDVVAVHEDGRVALCKLPSTPGDYGRAIVDGVNRVAEGSGVDVQEVIHGTTVATNAVLGGTGARTGLITTRGFRDVLEIGRLRMPRLYDLSWEKPRPLVPRYLRLEVKERITAGGDVLEPLDEESVNLAIERLIEERVVSVAVCLLNAYVNPDHEIRIGELLRTAGRWAVTLSSEVLPEIKEYERTSTTVINAYVMPVVRSYLSDLRTRLKTIGVDAPLRIMLSGGGVTEAGTAVERPVLILESGPAAGVVAAASLGRRIGCGNLIAFDMGGTTAKASLIEDGRISRISDYEVGGGLSIAGRLMGGGGYPVKAPSIDLAEIGAGGGSILEVDGGGALHVGPESAGADPGPVSYGRGGDRPTLTDANLLLGYLNPGGPADGCLPLDVETARDVMEECIASKMDVGVDDAALGAHRIAIARMVRAVRAVSSERGRDPRQYSLLAFGGSGPLHAVGMAGELGIRTVLVPPAPGLFSAVGLVSAGLQCDLARTRLEHLLETEPVEIQLALETMADEVRGRLPGSTVEYIVDLRYAGQSFELPVRAPLGPWDRRTLADLGDAFEAEHERTYGHRSETDTVEMVTLRVRAILPDPPLPDGRILAASAESVRTADTRPAYFGTCPGWVETPVLSRRHLEDSPISGPLIVEDYDATTLVPPNVHARLDEWRNIVIEVE
ncbi:MAG: hydantoinase/oxoprolinase family protein [Gemmatimonadota bacterium]|nr:hydantoinase/oxoprolinase family protein [Gemmatimonadota bacterium]